MASGYDGTIRIDSKVDTKGFNQGVKQMSGGVGSLIGILGKLGAAVTAAFAVGKLVAFSKQALIVAANYQRIEQAAVRVGATVGITADEVTRIVGELRDMGIQGDIANDSFINFARNGLDTKLLPALARGAQDLNAFADSGVSSSEVFDRLLTGVVQLSPIMLRTAGVIVDLSEANERWATANKTTVERMTDQQRQAAALEETIRKLAATEGLYELSQRTAAGQMSSNKRIMSDFMAALGGPFQNALYIVVLTINQMVKAFTAAIGPGGQLHGLFVTLAAVATWVANAFRAVAQWIAAIFGIAIPAIQGIATTADGAAAGLGGAAGAAEDLGEATEGAGKAAKGALAPFDELNVLQMEKDTGEGGGTPPGGGGGAPGVPFVPIESGLLDEINKRLDELKENLFGAGSLFEPLITALQNLYLALLPLGETIWEGLKWAWDNILVPIGEWVVTDALPAFLELLATAADTLNIALEALKPLAKEFYDEVLVPLGEWTGEAIVTVLDTLKSALEGIGKWIQDNPQTFQGFIFLISAVVMAFVAVNVALAIFNALLAINPIVLIILAIIALILVLGWLYNNWDEVKKKVEEFVKIAKEKLDAFVTNIEDNVIDPIKEAWKTFWEETVPEAVQKGINLMKNVVRYGINVVLTIFNGLGSGIASVINAVITALNKIQIKVPEALQKLVGFTSFGFNISPVTFTPIPLLPMIELAKGGVIPPNAEFLAMLGDQRTGRNLEAPEGLIRQIVREESGAGGTIVIEFRGSMADLVRQLKPAIDRENSRIGKSLIKVGA